MTHTTVSRLDTLGLRVGLSIVAIVVGSSASRLDRVSAQQPAVRDSTGISIVEGRTPEVSWSLSPTPVVRLGAVEAPVAQQFSRVGFAATLEDERVVVVDPVSREVRFFTPDGTHDATVGREGEGPGEFMTMSDIVLDAGDTLWIHDRRTRRVTAITPSGELQRTFSVSHLYDLGLSLQLLGPMEGGRLAAAMEERFEIPSGSYGRTRRFTIVSFDPKSPEDVEPIVTELPDRQVLTIQREWQSPTGRSSNMVLSPEVPMSHSAHYAVSGSHLIIATTDRPEYRSVDASGATRRIVRLMDRKAIRARAFFDDYLEYVAAAARADGRPEAEPVARAEELLDLLADDHTLPHFDRVLVDPLGRLWIRDPVPRWDDGRMRTWTVFSAEGTPLARLDVPADIHSLALRARHADREGRRRT